MQYEIINLIEETNQERLKEIINQKIYDIGEILDEE